MGGDEGWNVVSRSRLCGLGEISVKCSEAQKLTGLDWTRLRLISLGLVPHSLCSCYCQSTLNEGTQ